MRAANAAQPTPRSDFELRYVLDAKPVYEVLRGEMVQLAALLLTQLTACERRIVDPACVEISRPSLAEAFEKLRGLRAPASAAHHRWHLEAAAQALERAERAALSRAGVDRDTLFPSLEDAEAHLRAASKTLPGFERVDFRQACCAAHAQPATQPFVCNR